MSDYAGPILGVVGAVIGSVVPGLGTAAGFAIGSAIGNMISSAMQVIPGPKIGDVQKQTAIEGGFRPFLYGRSNPISGNVIADHEPYIVKKRERQGKGGPKVESESAYRTYAVGFCEGEASLLQVWRNGILVYDVEDAVMAPENAEFLKYARWHTGSFQQMPDPSIEGTHGVGNAPAFRGTAYLVLTREDVTDQRGAWSQWQVRVFRGTTKSYTSHPYPLELYENSSVSVVPISGSLKTSLYKSTSDESSSIAISPIFGELRGSVVVVSPDESASVYIAPISGVLSSSFIDTSLDDSAMASVTPMSGILKASLIRSQPNIEGSGITITPISGKLE